MTTPGLSLSDFDFDLPEDLIATRPAVPRSSARMLVAEGDRITDAHAFDLPGWLRPGDLLVLNDTRVIPARLSGVRLRAGTDQGGAARIEVTLLEPRPGGTWMALLRPLKKVRDGEVIRFTDRLSARLVGRSDGQGELEFSLTGADLDALGEVEEIQFIDGRPMRFIREDVIVAYRKRLMVRGDDLPGDADIAALSLQDALGVRRAILGFFQAAWSALSRDRKTSSSSDSNGRRTMSWR